MEPTTIIELNKANWLRDGFSLTKLKNVAHTAQSIKNVNNVVFFFTPYNAEKREINKYCKRIDAICAASGHTAGKPTFRKIKGIEISEMEVRAEK